MLKMPGLARDRYQPDRNYSYNFDRNYTFNQRVLASMVGVVALGLPTVLLALGHGDGCFRDSISDSYYTRYLGTVLVGSLSFIGGILIAYRGLNKRENWYATFAGIGALGVAFFPVNGPGCPPGQSFVARAFVTNDGASPPVLGPAAPGYFKLFGGVETLHHVSTLLIFAFLTWYCLVVFTRPVDEGRADPSLRSGPAKGKRNAIYVACGAVMLVAGGAMLLRGIYLGLTKTDIPHWDDYNVTFWAEALTLWAFGLSWTVKGRFFGKILND